MSLNPKYRSNLLFLATTLNLFKKCISVPKHCQVTSKLFTIKPVHTHARSSEEVTKLNIIYKIEENYLLLENVDKNKNDEMKQGQRALKKLDVSSKTILNHINKTRQKLSLIKKQSNFRLAGWCRSVQHP